VGTVPVSRVWNDPPDPSVLYSARPAVGRAVGAMAENANYLAGWRFRREVTAIVGNFTMTAYGAGIVLHSQTNDVVRVPFFTSAEPDPDITALGGSAVAIWVGITYYAEYRPTLATDCTAVAKTMSGVIQDQIEWSSANGTLSMGRVLTPQPENPNITGLNDYDSVLLTAHTGFDVDEDVALPSTTPRPLVVPAASDLHLELTYHALGLYSVSIWEMYRGRI